MPVMAQNLCLAFQGSLNANFAPLIVFLLSDGFAFTCRLHADNGESARN